MKLKQLQINKNPEIDPNDKIDKLESMIEKLLNDVKDIKSNLNISDIGLGKKFAAIDEKMKNIYENLNSLKSLHKKEIEKKENDNPNSNKNQIQTQTQIQTKIQIQMQMQTQNTNSLEQKEQKEQKEEKEKDNMIKVPLKLSTFLKIDDNTELPKKEIFQIVWNEFEKRGLIYEKNKRVLRVDNETSELFNIPMSVNNSTDHRDKHCFNYSSLQRCIMSML
jgi:hypothetical protein